MPLFQSVKILEPTSLAQKIHKPRESKKENFPQTEGIKMGTNSCAKCTRLVPKREENSK
jgi:hypothetical protein